VWGGLGLGLGRTVDQRPGRSGRWEVDTVSWGRFFAGKSAIASSVLRSVADDVVSCYRVWFEFSITRI
jgi:hypothetical protein